MKKSFPSISVRQSLRRLGADIRSARLRRRIPLALLAERASICQATLAKIQRGDPSVSMGNYAAVIFSLGFKTPFEKLLALPNDQVGLLLEEEELPKRIRFPKRKEEEEY